MLSVVSLKFGARFVGTTLQLFGLLIAAKGVAEMRQSYAPERLGAVGTVLVWTNRRQAALSRFIRRWVLRRTDAVEVHSGATSSSINLSHEAYGQITHGPVDTNASVDERLEALDQRSRETRDHLNRLDTQVRT
jgi:hypothetical protein